MKRVFLVVLLTAFAAVAQAGDTKAAAKETAPKEAACCSKPKTEPTSLETTKAEPQAEASGCGCCSRMTAKKATAKPSLLSPKSADLARR